MNHLPVMDQLDGDGDESLTYDGDESFTYDDDESLGEW